MVDFLELASRAGEQLIGFRSSLDGPGLAAEGPRVDLLGRACFYQHDQRRGAFARMVGMGAEDFVTGNREIKHALEA